MLGHGAVGLEMNAAPAGHSHRPGQALLMNSTWFWCSVLNRGLGAGWFLSGLSKLSLSVICILNDES